MNNFLIRLFADTLFLLLTHDPAVIGLQQNLYDHLDGLLANVAIKGELINGVIKLDSPETGRIGHGEQAIVWKGTFYDKRRNDNFSRCVAVKVSTDDELANNESKIYRDLDAFDKEQIEQYGISVLYYEGQFLDQYPIKAITLFERSLKDKLKFLRILILVSILF